MDPKWYPPADRPLQNGNPNLLAAGAIGITSLLLPFGQTRQILSIPPVLWLFYNLRQHTNGKAEENYMLAVNLAMTLGRVVDVCALRHAENELYRVNPDGSASETAEDIQNMTLWQKFCWTLDLFTTYRGIGWNWRVKNVAEVPPDTSRSRFVLEQVLRAAYCFLYLDFDDWLIRRTQFGSATSPSLDFFSLPVGQQVFLAWKGAFRSGFQMGFGYYLVAALAVGTGLYQPQSWPPFYGSFTKKGFTVRNIWGSCWHQVLRRTFEMTNGCFTKALAIQKGTITSRYFQLYNAFFVSAVIHHMGALNLPYSLLGRSQFYFFMIQPVAITIEDLAIYLGKKAGLKDTWKSRAVGYVWTGCFLSYSLRFATAGIIAAGLGGVRHPLVVRFSILDRLFG